MRLNSRLFSFNSKTIKRLDKGARARAASKNIKQPFNLLFNPLPKLDLSIENTVLIILDVQRLTISKSGTIAILAREKGVLGELNEYFELVRIMIPNIRLLIGKCRELGIQIIFTRLASHTKTGRDMSVQNKARGIGLTMDSDDSHFTKDLIPEPGDLIIDKVCDNPFNCTELGHILKNLRVKNLILCGVRTPGYLNTTAFDAADRGFGVIIVPDACAGGVRESKQYLTGGLIRLRPTSNMLELLAPLSEGRG